MNRPLPQTSVAVKPLTTDHKSSPRIYSKQLPDINERSFASRQRQVKIASTGVPSAAQTNQAATGQTSNTNPSSPLLEAALLYRQRDLNTNK